MKIEGGLLLIIKNLRFTNRKEAVREGGLFFVLHERDARASGGQGVIDNTENVA